MLLNPSTPPPASERLKKGGKQPRIKRKTLVAMTKKESSPLGMKRGDLRRRQKVTASRRPRAVTARWMTTTKAGNRSESTTIAPNVRQRADVAAEHVALKAEHRPAAIDLAWSVEHRDDRPTPTAAGHRVTVTDHPADEEQTRPSADDASLTETRDQRRPEESRLSLLRLPRVSPG